MAWWMRSSLSMTCVENACISTLCCLSTMLWICPWPDLLVWSVVMSYVQSGAVTIVCQTVRSMVQCEPISDRNLLNTIWIHINHQPRWLQRFLSSVIVVFLAYIDNCKTTILIYNKIYWMLFYVIILFQINFVLFTGSNVLRFKCQIWIKNKQAWWHLFCSTSAWCLLLTPWN